MNIMAKRLIRQGDLISVGRERGSLCYLVITQNDKGIVMYCPENGNWVTVPTEVVREHLRKDEWYIRVPERY